MMMADVQTLYMSIHAAVQSDCSSQKARAQHFELQAVEDQAEARHVLVAVISTEAGGRL